MTVKELREALAQYDDSARVEIYDSEHGYIDITEVFKSDSPMHKNNIMIY